MNAKQIKRFFIAQEGTEGSLLTGSTVQVVTGRIRPNRPIGASVRQHFSPQAMHVAPQAKVARQFQPAPPQRCCPRIGLRKHSAATSTTCTWRGGGKLYGLQLHRSPSTNAPASCHHRAPPSIDSCSSLEQQRKKRRV